MDKQFAAIKTQVQFKEANPEFDYIYKTAEAQIKVTNESGRVVEFNVTETKKENTMSQVEINYVEKMTSETRAQNEQREKSNLIERTQCFADGKDIAVEMIKSGWAIAYRPYHKVQEPMYLKYEDEARSQNKGVWGSGFQWPHTYRKFGNKHVNTAPIKTPY
ncbi:MAG: thermonuclease family protein [Rhizobiales bacterium]|nr:thermonuclease family protein [Hyphomicrobiales bacterium]